MDFINMDFNSPWPTTPPNEEDIGIRMDMITDFQEAFEPQQRARSNTWPCPRPDNFLEPVDDSGSTKCSTQQLATVGGQPTNAVTGSTQKKNSSRRNAWGNLSYADLITQAISSSPESRLTLSQIYEWMVQNVAYFKDKGDSNSSAGWKNSIRHNLSLHNRFMRVQNEGTGKSSWWMLNPDAKPGKSVRRRAASMETQKYEKRRGRAKKRVEALRNAGITGLPGLNDATPSPSSSVSEGLDLFPDSPLHSGGFQLSPDFRQRASSNASSCGRLSPIPAIPGEPDWGYSQQEYATNDATSAGLTQPNPAVDKLVGTFADELTIQNEFLQGFSNASAMHNQPPPPYQSAQPYTMHATVPQSYVLQPNQCQIHRRQSCSCLQNSTESMSPSSGTGLSPAYPHSEPSPDPMGYNTTLLIDSQHRLIKQSNSPPLTPSPQNNSIIIVNKVTEVPSTLMGQVMEALNGQPPIDDLNLIDSFTGGLECNVEEVIQQELNFDGLLDINIPITNQNNTGSHTTNLAQNSTINAIGLQSSQSTTSHAIVQYPPTNVTSPSWVH